ncbi:ABC transporter ATP-binding protein [Mesorhizobium sp.]|uniref:ABC transporter ATP-binding protein n=1 Tax=Mesorhizobium sp. TaxID=1871066 RepID=UPI000FE666C2|nr:ABC transporter ATP-binding protein [Mesorhizobium sp.]RWN26431.1 MAG: ABC transporter ATP-binding protein [Mesorhizobium sp.]
MPEYDNAQDPLITFHKVNKTYDGKIFVVIDLCLEIYRGEFLALLGPSGSGKSTTLGMLAGFEHPSSGSITLGGKSLEDTPTHKRKFGMVFQNYSLFPHMSVMENIIFPLRMQGMSRAEAYKLGQAALELVDLRDPGMGKRRPDQLSGGQQQRIALARALVFEPLVILFDEPLGALDKRLREQMQLELRQLHKRLGVTMIFVTHDQSEALTMADRVAVFDKGRIQQIASPMRLYDEPETAFVASFVGENNKFEAKVVRSQGEICEVALCDGTKAEGVSPRRLSPGAGAVLVVRPERVVVSPADDCSNKYGARIKEVIELGDQTRLRLDIAGDNEILVKVPRISGVPGYQIGQELVVGWKAQDCRILEV